MRIYMICLLALLTLTGATAIESSPTTPPESDGVQRSIHDGSFESGSCQQSEWTCWSDPDCGDIIVDPESCFGFPAHDGTYAAWLGGRCGEIPRSCRISQETVLSYGVMYFRWKAFVEDGHSGNFLYVKVNGNIIHAMELTWPDHHDLSSWTRTEVIIPNPSTALSELSFEFAASNGANIFIDDIELGP